MATKYLYLDDETLTTLQSLTTAVSGANGDLVIDVVHPASFHDDLQSLIKRLSKYDGLILDWRLDVFGESRTNAKFNFRAAALAQEIRTRSAERSIRSMPIVLWSTQSRLAGSYTGDHTSHDLFDRCYDKENISDHAQLVRKELLALVEGYKTIANYLKRRNRSLGSLLQVESGLDVRVRERFISKEQPVYEYARFILRELIERPGPLVSELLLSARLGIDMNGSKHWQRLLEQLSKYKYNGPFNKTWQRWWISGIEREWWFALEGVVSPLSALTGKARVDIIRRATGLKNLTVAPPIRPNYHTQYHTICEYYQRPLDPVDGVIIQEKEPEPWQDRRYIALDVALERRSEIYIPHPTELQKLKELKRRG